MNRIQRSIPIPAGERIDEGRQPIGLQERDVLPFDGTPSAIQDVLDFVREQASRDQRVMPMGGRSSSGLMTLENADLGTGVRGLEIPLITSGEELRPYLDFKVEGGIPRSVRVPANATIQALEQAVVAEFGPSYGFGFDITTRGSSALGANLATGGLGDSREALNVSEVEMIGRSASGLYEHLFLRGAEVDSLRGTQGYAGQILTLEMPIQKVQPNEEYWVLNLPGQGAREIYGRHYAALLKVLWPYMHYRGDIQITGVEILHESGLKAIERNSGHKNEDAEWYRARFLKGAEGSLILKVRHGFEETLAGAIDEDHPFFQAFVRSVEGGHIEEFDSIVDHRGMSRLERVRYTVPEMARKGGGKSLDVDTVLQLHRLTDAHSHEDIGEALARSFRESMEPIFKAEERALEKGWQCVHNGHLLAVSRAALPGRSVPEYFDGGANPHFRFQGGPKDEIAVLHAQTNRTLHETHRGQFHPSVRVFVHEGEKHYPNDSVALAHLFSTRPDIARQRWTRIQRTGGRTFNFRMPQELREMGAWVDGSAAAK